MPSPRALPAYYGLLQAGFRMLSWATALVAILLLAYVGRSWPDMGQVIVAGILGSAIAMLNDSWEVAAITDSWHTLPRLTSSRRVLHDMFSLALSTGGIIMMWVSNVHIGETDYTPTYDERQEEKYLMAALWGLLAQAGWRLIHTVWGCIDCSRDARVVERRQRRRRRRRRQREYPPDPWDEIMGVRTRW